MIEFYRHAGMRDGRLNFCRHCVRGRVRQHRRDNDHVRERDRARGNRLPPGYLAEWREKNPEKYQAHTLLNNELRAGRIRKEPCAECGSEIGVHAHHHDYSRPLDVTWLCPLHHRREHARGIQ